MLPGMSGGPNKPKLLASCMPGGSGDLSAALLVMASHLQRITKLTCVQMYKQHVRVVA